MKKIILILLLFYLLFSCSDITKTENDDMEFVFGLSEHTADTLYCEMALYNCTQEITISVFLQYMYINYDSVFTVYLEYHNMPADNIVLDCATIDNPCIMQKYFHIKTLYLNRIIAVVIINGQIVLQTPLT